MRRQVRTQSWTLDVVTWCRNGSVGFSPTSLQSATRPIKKKISGNMKIRLAVGGSNGEKNKYIIWTEQQKRSVLKFQSIVRCTDLSASCQPSLSTAWPHHCCCVFFFSNYQCFLHIACTSKLCVHPRVIIHGKARVIVVAPSAVIVMRRVCMWEICLPTKQPPGFWERLSKSLIIERSLR